MPSFEKQHFGGSIDDDPLSSFGVDPLTSWAYQQRQEENRRLLEARIQDARYDRLTGLLSDRAFRDDAPTLLERIYNPRRAGDPNDALFLMFDLILFSEVNNKKGQLVGDRSLVSFADFLKTGVRQKDTDMVARTGGDEFTAILPLLIQGAHSKEEVQAKRDKLKQTIINRLNARWLKTMGPETPSVRYYFAFPESGDSIDTLKEKADPKLHEDEAIVLEGLVLAA